MRFAPNGSSLVMVVNGELWLLPWPSGTPLVSAPPPPAARVGFRQPPHSCRHCTQQYLNSCRCGRRKPPRNLSRDRRPPHGAAVSPTAKKLPSAEAPANGIFSKSLFPKDASTLWSAEVAFICSPTGVHSGTHYLFSTFGAGGAIESSAGRRLFRAVWWKLPQERPRL